MNVRLKSDYWSMGKVIMAENNERGIHLFATNNSKYEQNYRKLIDINSKKIPATVIKAQAICGCRKKSKYHYNEPKTPKIIMLFVKYKVSLVCVRVGIIFMPE